VHTSAPDDVFSSRRKLKQLDTALCLECPQYRGPMLPRDVSSKSSHVNGRLRRLTESLFDDVLLAARDLVHPEATVETSVYLPSLPFVDLYRLDYLISAPKAGDSRGTVIFVHLPEDYVEDKSTLLGPQLMRHRHLRLHGYKTIAWDFDVVLPLTSSAKKDELARFLNESLSSSS
jgi:Xaa-Pro dipeptidase